MQKYILKWQILGIVFIFILGNILHFLFEWSGYFYPIGAIAAVNESVWEHLKLGFWPLIFFAPIEYKFVKEEINNFILAKTIAAFIIPIFIVVVFYSYTAILRIELLIVDILIFLIAIAIAQFVSYKILILNQFPKYVSKIALISIIFLATLYVVFTYFPPHLPIFQDSQTGLYGITAHTQ